MPELERELRALAVTLDWPDGVEADLAGYVVYRGFPGGPYTRLSPTLLPYSTFADRAPVEGAVYVVRAMDTTGNLSPASPEAPAPPVTS